SPGGDVFAAQSIAAALERHKAKVVAHIDGLAASAATAIAVACDEVYMAAGSMFMIHNAWTFAVGDKNDFMDTAALLEKVDSTLADRYAKRTGKKAPEMAALMDAETWFTADEAVAAGFANALELEEESTPGAKARAMWNLAAFEHAPAAPPSPPAPEKPVAEAPT